MLGRRSTAGSGVLLLSGLLLAGPLLAGCTEEPRAPFGEVNFSVDPPPGLTGTVDSVTAHGSDDGYDDNPVPTLGGIYPGTEDPISRPLEE